MRTAKKLGQCEGEQEVQKQAWELVLDASKLPAPEAASAAPAAAPAAPDAAPAAPSVPAAPGAIAHILLAVAMELL